MEAKYYTLLSKIILQILICLYAAAFVYGDGTCIKGNCTNGQGTYTWATGEKYIGEWKDDKYNGQGTLTFANAEKYVGDFENDKYNGQGTLIFANGDKYVGDLPPKT